MLQHRDSKQPALITPIVLQWARKTLGLSESEAAQKLRVSVEKLIAWESGVEVVPVKKLHVLAKVYKRPSAVFLFDEEPSGDIPASFRRLFDFYANEFTQDTILAIRKAIRT